MKLHKKFKTLIPAAFGIAVLILDGSTAINGARAGLEVCLRTVVPSLFPFLFLSSMLTSSLSTTNRRGKHIISRLYGIPQGGESILLTGLLGGYPVGAKCIGEAVSQGRLSCEDGKRMLVFCNAAGPAFLFGIAGSLFSQRWVPWCLWGVHLLSGLWVARILHQKTSDIIKPSSISTPSPIQQLRQSIRVMGEICGWIILMRTVITIAQKWCLWYLPNELQILFSGILELSNGCISLTQIENTGLRFLLCSVFLGFGGLCVALQTGSAASAVSQRAYLPGKFLQATISFIIAYIAQCVIFDTNDSVHMPWLFCLALLFFNTGYIYFRVKQKSGGILVNIGV